MTSVFAIIPKYGVSVLEELTSYVYKGLRF